MSQGRELSQETFSKIEDQIQEIKQKALARNDPEGWGEADKLHWLLLRFVEDQIVEGSVVV